MSLVGSLNLLMGTAADVIIELADSETRKKVEIKQDKSKVSDERYLYRWFFSLTLTHLSRRSRSSCTQMARRLPDASLST